MIVDVADVIRQLQGLNLDALYVKRHRYELIQSALSSIVSEKLQTSTTTPTLPTLAAPNVQTLGISWEHGASEFNQSSNSTIPLLPSTTSSRTALWQTAFWGIAAIALSTCLQDCGRVCGIQKEFALLIRSSPVFCFADSLIILFQLTFYTITKGPRRAMQIITKCRDQHSFDIENAATKPVQWFIHGILLVLAVVQSIKVFALRGIPWTQFFAACYLASYALNGLLNVFGKPPPELSPDDAQIPQQEDIVPRESLISNVADLACVAQIGLWTVALKPVAPASFHDDWCLFPLHLLTLVAYGFPLHLIISIIFFGTIMIDTAIVLIPLGVLYPCLQFRPFQNVPSILQGLSSLLDASTTIIAPVLLVAIGCLFLWLRFCKWPIWLIWELLKWIDLESMDNYIKHGWKLSDPYFVTLTCIMLAAAFSYLLARIFLFGVLAEKLRLRQLPVASSLGWAALFLFVANIGFGLLYYSRVYDPTHTYKPLWVENLGKTVFPL